MARVLQFLLFAFLLFVAGTIAAFVLLPWWQALIVVLVIIFGIVYGTQYVIRSAWRQIGSTVTKELEKRSAVLRGAQAEVHEVVAAEAPPKDPDDDDDDDEPGEDEGPKAYYQIDVTVRPAPPAPGDAASWSSSDLHLVAFNAAAPKLDLTGGHGDNEESYEPLNVQVEQRGAYVPDEDGEHEGPRRLRLLYAVPERLKEAKFQYYGEQFGHVRLPAPPPPQAPPPPPMLT